MKIYGPVPSWRLGNSLGVDIVESTCDGRKICSFNCVYCQLGAEIFHVTKPYEIPVHEEDFLLLKEKIQEVKPDVITFSGEGEPTINLNLGCVAKRIRQFTAIPLTLLTNASFIQYEKVRENMEQCDLVILKLDAPRDDLFAKINQPCFEISLNEILEGITKLKTSVAIQTLMFSFKEITNADTQTVTELITMYKKIHALKAVKIFLGTSYRPSGENILKSVSEKELKKIAVRISAETGIEVEYYSNREVRAVERKMSDENLAVEILRLLERRPCTQSELEILFRGNDIPLVLSKMLSAGVLSSKNVDQKEYLIKAKE